VGPLIRPLTKLEQILLQQVALLWFSSDECIRQVEARLGTPGIHLAPGRHVAKKGVRQLPRHNSGLPSQCQVGRRAPILLIAAMLGKTLHIPHEKVKARLFSPLCICGRKYTRACNFLSYTACPNFSEPCCLFSGPTVYLQEGFVLYPYHMPCAYGPQIGHPKNDYQTMS